MLTLANDNEINMLMSDAKQLFGENTPYIIERRLEGSTIIFSEHFISCLREALTTGCMAKMDSEEERMFLAWTGFESANVSRDIATAGEDVMEALDKWMANLAMCKPNPIMNNCFDNVPIVWNKCSGQ